MKHRMGIAGVLVVLAVLAGCNTAGRQPQFTRAIIAPAELKPGDTAVITVDLKDKHDIVHSVEGIVREDPNIKLKLKQESAPAEKPKAKKAGESAWVLQVDVPFQAPTGDFTLDVTGYSAAGQPVLVKGPEGKTGPLAVSVPVVIKNP